MSRTATRRWIPASPRAKPERLRARGHSGFSERRTERAAPGAAQSPSQRLGRAAGTGREARPGAPIHLRRAPRPPRHARALPCWPRRRRPLFPPRSHPHWPEGAASPGAGQAGDSGPIALTWTPGPWRRRRRPCSRRRRPFRASAPGTMRGAAGSCRPPASGPPPACRAPWRPEDAEPGQQKPGRTGQRGQDRAAQPPGAAPAGFPVRSVCGAYNPLPRQDKPPRKGVTNILLIENNQFGKKR